MVSQLMHNVLIGSLVSSTLVVLLISFRQIIIKNIGATWNYFVWFTIFVPWVAVWLPWGFSSSPNLKITTIIKPLNYIFINNPDQFNISLPKAFFIFWLSGIIICLIHILFNHFKFISRLKVNSRLMIIDEREAIKKVLTNFQKKYISRIHISTAIESPMICHFIKSKIYLPNNFFEIYSNAEQKYIIQHEFVHFQRCDLLTNAAMLLLGCFNWFNPIMFFAYRYFRNAQELSCDAVVSQRLTSNEKKEYGYTLLKTVINQYSRTSLMSCSWYSQKQLKERCQMLKFHHLKPKKSFLGIGLLTATMCTAIAAPTLEKHKLQSTISKITYSANMIQPALEDNGNLLNGHVRLDIGNEINISADKVLVKYTEEGQHVVDKIIIYGQGTLTEGDHSIQILNGTFNPNTLQLSAEKIDRRS